MFPVLISFGSFTFYTFNLFVILGLIIALYVVWKKTKEEVEDEEQILDISLLTVIFGLLGGRLFEGILSWKTFGTNIYRILAFWTYPGFTVWGAFGAGSLALYLICRKNRLNWLKILDYLVCGLSVGLPFLFLGHIFAGSYFGAQTQFFWGISIPGLLGKRHPTAVIGFFVSILISFAVLKFSSKKHFYGATALLFLILYSLFAFMIEWLRGDSLYLERKLENLFFSAAVFLICAGLFYYKSQRDIREDLALLLKALNKIVDKFTAGVVLSKKFILKRRRKVWKIPETHYKI